MFSRLFCVLAMGVTVSVSWTATAAAAPINYGDFLGANPGEPDFLQVTEDSTSDPPPLFGAPIQAGNSLLFLPSVFAASTADGTYDSAAGTLTMRIKADEGYYLEKINLNEIGDCTLLGIGAAWADVYGLLSVRDITPGAGGVFGSILSIDPLPPYWTPSFTTFTGTAEIDLSGLHITEVALAFNDTLEAYSALGTTAFIQKKVFQIGVTSVPVPEPATGLLAIISGFALLTRRLSS